MNIGMHIGMPYRGVHSAFVSTNPCCGLLLSKHLPKQH